MSAPEPRDGVATLRRMLDALWTDSGRPERDDDDDVLGVLIRMVLGQATSKANASAAFGQLLDEFEGDWAKIEHAAHSAVAASITVGGLANQKAPRIQGILRRTRETFGGYSLEPLREWTSADALGFLLGLDGVGPTTARFALMYAAGHDLFPINAGIRRVLRRAGVLDGTESDTKAHERASEALPAGWGFGAHMTLVQHARTLCARAPECERCAARAECPRLGLD